MLLKATFLTGITSLNVGLLQLKGLKQIVQVYLHIKFKGRTKMYSERFKANCSSFAYIFNSKGVQRCILKGLKQIVQVLLRYLIQWVYRDIF